MEQALQCEIFDQIILKIISVKSLVDAHVPHTDIS